MAKKGVTVSLQVDIQTQEDFERMLAETRRIVIVADIYSEWCGPCTGMQGNLRKVKLEVGGDFVFYTTIKNDYIDKLYRFRRQSEPVWMFIVNGQMTNLMLGPDGPRLMRMVVDEVNKQKEVAEKKRPFQGIDIAELSAEELHRIAVKEEAEFEAKKLERELLMQKLFERRLFVAESVGTGMPTHTVLVLWPHAKDALQEFVELFDELGLEVVADTSVELTHDLIEDGFFDAKPIPLSHNAKLALTSGETTIVLIAAKEEGFTLPSVEVAMKMAIDSGLGEKWLLEYEVVVEDEGDTEEDEQATVSEPAPQTGAASTVETADASDVNMVITSEYFVGEGDDDNTSVHDAPEPTAQQPDQKTVTQSEVSTADAPAHTEQVPKSHHAEVEVVLEYIPGVYSPMTTISRGAALVTFFPRECKEVTPPEPKPVAPHSLLVFDAFKRKDVIDLINENIEFVMQIGFFSSDDPNTAQLLAKTLKEYGQIRPSPDHKLMVQVMTKPSAGLLTLVQLGPTYCSTSAEVGEIECKRYFPLNYCPDGYQIEEEEEEVVESVEEPEPVVVATKKGKGKKGKGAAAAAAEVAGDEGEYGEEGEGEEEEEEGEDGCPLDDMPLAEEE